MIPDFCIFNLRILNLWFAFFVESWIWGLSHFGFEDLWISGFLFCVLYVHDF